MEGNIGLLLIILWPVLGGIIGFFAGKKKLSYSEDVCDIVTFTELAMMGYFAHEVLFKGNVQTLEIENLMGLGLNLKADGFQVIYGLLTAGAWFLVACYSKEYLKGKKHTNRYRMFFLFTLSAAIGVFLADNAYIMFVFFEIMSFVSFPLVIQEETKEAKEAGASYFAIAIIGGLMILMGILCIFAQVGSFQFDVLQSEVARVGMVTPIMMVGGILVLLGFGAKASLFPMHTWLPKTYPASPAPATAMLSSILTKTGVAGMIFVVCDVMFPSKEFGTLVLVLGTITMVWGGIMALASDDIMKTLAGSSMSQIGFITVGLSMCGLLGEENGIAVNGTFLHMVNHTLFKLALFFLAGVVVSKLGSGKLDDIRGYGKGKPLFRVCFALSGLGIAGVPLLNGYVSKTLIHEALVEYGNPVAEWLFLISGGLTLAYMLKLYVVLFWEKPSEQVSALKVVETSSAEVVEGVAKDSLQEDVEGAVETTVNEVVEEASEYSSKKTAVKKDMSFNTWFAFLVPVICYPVMGLLPNVVMDRLAELGSGFFHGASLEHKVQYFSIENLKGSAISIVIGLVLYFVVVRCLLRKKTEAGVSYRNGLPAWCDLEKVIYRPLLLKVLPCIGTFISRILDWVVDAIVLVMHRTIYRDNNREEKPVYAGRLLDGLGEFLNILRRLWNKTVGKKHPLKINFVVEFAKLKKKSSTRIEIISKSVSFGLFMFAVGFCLTIAYLIYLM